MARNCRLEATGKGAMQEGLEQLLQVAAADYEQFRRYLLCLRRGNRCFAIAPFR